MTNPNNAVGTNGAYGGRTSVNALNDILSSFNGRGIVSGWNCQASSGMTVTLGGVVGSRDVAIAEDNIGNKTTVNNISASPIEVTLPAAPTANNRIDLIVAYVANPPQGSATVVDNPSACGLIVVSSAVAANPTAPTEANIRTAITEDGATGTNAYYVVLASIAVSAGLSTVTDNLITQGSRDGFDGNNITNNSVTSSKIDWTTMGYKFEQQTIPLMQAGGNGFTTISIADAPAGSKWLAIYTGYMYIGAGNEGHVQIRYGASSSYSNDHWINNRTSSDASLGFSIMHLITKDDDYPNVLFFYDATKNNSVAYAECALIRVG